jgi:hypothetical protein
MHVIVLGMDAYGLGSEPAGAHGGLGNPSQGMWQFETTTGCILSYSARFARVCYRQLKATGKVCMVV